MEEWIKSQLWGTDLVSTLNKQQHIHFVQLALTLSLRRPWAWWNIHIGDKRSIVPKTNPKEKKAVLSMLKSDSFGLIQFPQ